MGNPTAPKELAVRLYEFDPAKKEKFFDFYRDWIIPWLKDKERGVKDAVVWTVERKDLFLFAISTSPTDPPWSDITGLDQFVKDGQTLATAELPLVNRPIFHIPQPEAAPRQ